MTFVPLARLEAVGLLLALYIVHEHKIVLNGCEMYLFERVHAKGHAC